MHETPSQISEEELKALQRARESGIVYERGLVTSKKWMAGTNAGGLLLSDFFQVPMGLGESVANSKLGQAVQEVKTRRQKSQPSELTQG